VLACFLFDAKKWNKSLFTRHILSSMLIFSINIVLAANFIYLLDIEILSL